MKAAAGSHEEVRAGKEMILESVKVRKSRLSLNGRR
jgi:hypothetical protein